MHPQTQLQDSGATTSTDHKLDDHQLTGSNDQYSIINTELGDEHVRVCGNDGDQLDEDDNMSDFEAAPTQFPDNNPPESFAVCQAKVAEWLEYRHTFMERKASVKFAVCNQNKPSRRSISLNQKPKLSIIGFRKKPVQPAADGKPKHNDRAENVRLFRNRSEPGRDYCLLITEPVSPRVSCVGRVGSVRVQGRKAGVWRSFKTAFSNLVQTSRATKIAA